MLSDLLKNKSLFYRLYLIDKKVAEKYRKKPCPYCNSTLHYANYPRKPRGESNSLQEECFIRFSLCCSKEGCRRRLIPPSCRFMGRKVYWQVVILVTISDGQNKSSDTSTFKLSSLLGIPHNTIKRWIDFFRNIFPSSQQWQRLRGLITSTIKNTELPASLINYFLTSKSSALHALVSCLKFLSQGSGFYHKIRAG